MFKTATKTQSKLRLALVGPAGSGKTFTALALATNLGKRVAVIDTERGSASKYSDLFKFDVGELPTHHPEQYIEAIRLAEEAGYDVLIIDSLSHAWSGKEGALELVDKAAAKSQSKNTYFAWRDVTPLHNQLVDAILQTKCHVIATMRAKTEHVLETDSRGKQVPKKVGLAPIQRDGVEYEFDVTADLTLDHDMIIGKTRCNLLDGKVYHKPGKDVAQILLSWVSEGVAASEPVVAFKPPTETLPADQPVDAMDAHNWVDVLTKQAAGSHIPQKFLNAYIKKRGGAESLTENQYLDAIAFVANVAEKMAEKYGETYTPEQVVDADVKAIFVELDK